MRFAVFSAAALAIVPLFGAACAEGSAVDPSGPLIPKTTREDAGAQADGKSIRVDSATEPPEPEEDSGAPPKADAATDTGSDSSNPPPTSACTTALAALTFSFDSGAQGFTHGVLDDADQSGAFWPFDPWAQGAAGNVLGCKSGSCFATELNANYAQCQRAYLESPTIDLSDCASEDVVLAFDHAYSFWSGSYASTTWYDGGIVEVSADGGSTWTVAGPYSYPGTLKINPNQTSSYQCVYPNSFHVDQKAGFVDEQTTWSRVEIPIAASQRTSTFKVRFAFSSGVSSQTTSASSSRAWTAPGWHLDNVAIEMGP